MKNKVLLFLLKLVLTVVIFFLCGLGFQYLDTGAPDYQEAFNHAITRAPIFVVIFELFDYFKMKKEHNS